MHRIVLLSSLVLAGCGANPAQRFTGTWSFASGSDNVSCPNGTTATKLTGNVTIKHATDGACSCSIPRAATSPTRSTATQRHGRTAARAASLSPSSAQGVTAAVTYDAITLATSDGKDMDDSFSGTVVYIVVVGNASTASSAATRRS